MASLNTILSHTVEGFAPRRQAARAKEAQRFDENLTQSLSTPAGDPPQGQTQVPPASQSANRHDSPQPSRDPREARAAHSRETRRNLSEQQKSGEASRDREIADISPFDIQDQKAEAVTEIDIANGPQTNATDNSVPSPSDTNAVELDPTDVKNALSGNAPIITPASIASEATLQSDGNDDNPILNTKLESKLSNPQPPRTQNLSTNEANTQPNISSAFDLAEDETQDITHQVNNGSAQENTTQETMPMTQATKSQTVILSPQARSALLNVNKNEKQPVGADAEAEGKSLTPNALNDTLTKSYTPQSTTPQSMPRQSVNEATLQSPSDALQTAFNEAPKPEATPALLTTTLDQNIPAPNTSSQSLPALTAAMVTPPQSVMGRGSHLPVPYARVPMEIGLATLEGQRSIQVRLSPADLGTIEIELDVSDQSEIHARIAADDPRTLAMLKQDAPLIRQALEQTGLSTNSDSLNFSLRQDGQSNNRQNPEDRSGSPSKLREQDLFSDPGHDGRPAPTPLRRVTSLLDMNI